VLSEELGDQALQLEGHKLMVIVLLNLGDLLGAEAQLVEYLEMARQLGSLRDEARATFLLGLTRYRLGELEEAERLGLQAADWLERTAESFYQLQNLRTLAVCAGARSDLNLAEERLRQAIPLALEIGGAQPVETYRYLLNVLIRQGRLSDARELAEFALRDLPEEDVYARAAGLLITASLTTAEGERDIACESFDEALRLLEQQQLPLDLGEAKLAYGKALRELGEDEAARAELAAAREHLVTFGARGLVDEIDRELAAIGEGAGPAGPLASS
jgi:tetratricopeptide (TPR) repeat protein